MKRRPETCEALPRARENPPCTGTVETGPVLLGGIVEGEGVVDPPGPPAFI